MNIRKQAGISDSLARAGTEIVNWAGDLVSTGAVYLLAAAATSGVGIGYAAAKMAAHGKQDEDTAKKEYENERLKADIGYLRARTNSEYQQFKNRQAVKPARVIA